MTAAQKKAIIKKFKIWFTETLIEKHKENTEKLKDLKEFNIHPFLLYYLSNYLRGNSKARSLAEVLVYPRVLGTSITTSFGTNMQSFITNVLGAFGSTTSGIDIEFIDREDKRKKYCQLKSGPNVINGPDVKTVKDHFKGIKNLAKTNNLKLHYSDLVLCLIYGDESEKNSFIREVEKDHVVYIGNEFWTRFTGDKNFYRDLIKAAGEVAREVNMKKIVEDVVSEVTKKIKAHFRKITT